MDLASINGENAFFRLKDNFHVSSFALFIVRYTLATLLPLALYLDNRELNKAIESSYVAINGSDEMNSTTTTSNSKEQEEEEIEDIYKNNTWKDLYRRMKLLWPFLWPKGDRVLQFYVVVCLCLLGAGRGINVLVPCKWCYYNISIY